MSEDAPKTENAAQTVSKPVALVLVLLYVFTAFTGYAFGVDAGYLKGTQDCTQRPLVTQELRMP